MRFCRFPGRTALCIGGGSLVSVVVGDAVLAIGSSVVFLSFERGTVDFCSSLSSSVNIRAIVTKIIAQMIRTKKTIKATFNTLVAIFTVPMSRAEWVA